MSESVIQSITTAIPGFVDIRITSVNEIDLGITSDVLSDKNALS